MNFLTDEEREQLKQKHRKERDGRVRDRIKSVILSDHGWTPKKIAEALLISEDAVRNHIQEYKNSKNSNLKTVDRLKNFLMNSLNL